MRFQFYSLWLIYRKCMDMMILYLIHWTWLTALLFPRLGPAPGDWDGTAAEPELWRKSVCAGEGGYVFRQCGSSRGGGSGRCVRSPLLPRLGPFGLNVETQPLGKDHSSADIQTWLLKMHLMLTKSLIIKFINHHNLTRHMLADVNCPFKKYSLLCCTEFKD